MLELDPDIVAIIALVAAGLAVVLLVVVVVIGMRLGRLRRNLARALGPADEDLVTVVGEHADRLGELGASLEELSDTTRHNRELISGVVSRLGMVRYDAFEDMGGALSFSAALLDEHGDGIVISAINGRTETRCYSKAIKGATSEHNLSEEEQAAIQGAMERQAPATLPPAGSRRRRRRAS
jgi:hypothetical protein